MPTVSVSLSSLGARVGPYSFQAENWNSLPVGHMWSVTLDLAFEKADADSTGKPISIQIQMLQGGGWAGNRNIQSVYLIVLFCIWRLGRRDTPVYFKDEYRVL